MRSRDEEAKAQLSALIEKVLGGEEVIIGKSGKPVAKLVRYERSEEPRRQDFTVLTRDAIFETYRIPIVKA